jgi:PAS domain S-box-containing protein
VVVTLFYLAMSLGLELLTVNTEPQATWRLSAGLAFGLLLLYGFQYIPLVFAGELFSTIIPGSASASALEPFVTAFIVSVAYMLVRTVVYRSIKERQIDLLTRRDFYILLTATPVTSFVVAALSAVSAWVAGSLPEVDFKDAVLRGTGANAVGILLMTPFSLMILGRQVERLVDRLSGESPAKSEPRQIQWLPLAGAAAVAAASLFCIAFFKADAGFGFFALLSLPLVATAIRFGLPGLGVMLAGIGTVLSTFGPFTSGDRSMYEPQLLAATAAVNALFLGFWVSQNRRQEAIAKRQAALLNSVSFATDQLLSMTDKEQNVNNVLEHLAVETGMTRTYVLENRPDLNFATQPLYEHWSANTKVDERHAQLLNGFLRKHIGESAATLSQGEVLQYRTADLPVEEQRVLSALNIRASIVLPIFAEGRWWGCLGMDQWSTDRLWSEAEISAFKATGRALAALLSHTNVEQQFRQLTGNIPAVFWIATPDGLEKTYVSPAYEEIWGWPYESIQNNPRSWIAPVYHEDYARISAALSKQMLGEYDEEYRIVRSDRSVRWIRETAFPVRDTVGQVTRIVGIAQDITRQKEAEESLKATSLLLSSLIDNLHAGIVVEDHARRIIHVNQAFCRMFDVAATADSLLGVDSRVVLTQPVWAQRIDEIIREGRECRGEEMASDTGRVFSRDYFPLSVDEDCNYHLWRYEDITERKRSEEKIRASLKEKEVLLKEIHHRVKNNLQVISSLLNLQATQIRDKETAQVFRDSQSRVKAMSLVHERLYQSSDLAKIDFAGYVQDVTTHLLRSYQTGRRAVKLNVDVDPVSFNIDTAIPCALIINELVSNSLKYAFPNGREGEIRIKMNQVNSDDLSLVISDNGVGFPGAFSWEQTDSLGLSLVRSLTDQLNGTVEYRNGKGTEFDIRFRPVTAESRN